jgi:hypothetical protein
MASLNEKFEIIHLLMALKAFNQAAMEKRSSWIPGLALELAFLETSQVGASSMPISSTSQSEASETTNPASQPLKNQGQTEAKPQIVSEADLVLDSSSSHLASANLPESSSEISFQEIRVQWREILQTVRQYDPRTQALLNSCVPIGVDEDTLILGFGSDLLRDKMEKDHNIAKACQAAEQVLGKPISLRCVITSKWRSEQAEEDQPPPMEEGGMVATAIRDLGAQVVDIEQLPPDQGP